MRLSFTKTASENHGANIQRAPALKKGLSEGLALMTVVAFGGGACHRTAETPTPSNTTVPIVAEFHSKTSLEETRERVRAIRDGVEQGEENRFEEIRERFRILGDVELLESQVVLSTSADGTRLIAEVFSFEPGLSFTSSTQVNRRLLLNPDITFEYYDLDQNRYISMNEMGLVNGNECDISNLVPSTIRALFMPFPGQSIRSDFAEYQMH